MTYDYKEEASMLAGWKETLVQLSICDGLVLTIWYMICVNISWCHMQEIHDFWQLSSEENRCWP